MSSIGELLGADADLLARSVVKVGDVHFLHLTRENGITPKGEAESKPKYFVVLGFNDKGDVLGGVVINSRINPNLPPHITDYYVKISSEDYPFLRYNSFVNCSSLIVAEKSLFAKATYRGRIEDGDFLMMLIETLKESPTVSKRMLKEFHLL